MRKGGPGSYHGGGETHSGNLPAASVNLEASSSDHIGTATDLQTATPDSHATETSLATEEADGVASTGGISSLNQVMTDHVKPGLVTAADRDRFRSILDTLPGRDPAYIDSVETGLRERGLLDPDASPDSPTSDARYAVYRARYPLDDQLQKLDSAWKTDSFQGTTAEAALAAMPGPLELSKSTVEGEDLAALTQAATEVAGRARAIDAQHHATPPDRLSAQDASRYLKEFPVTTLPEYEPSPETRKKKDTSTMPETLSPSIDSLPTLETTQDDMNLAKLATTAADTTAGAAKTPAVESPERAAAEAQQRASAARKVIESHTTVDMGAQPAAQDTPTRSSNEADAHLLDPQTRQPSSSDQGGVTTPGHEVGATTQDSSAKVVSLGERERVADPSLLPATSVRIEIPRSTSPAIDLRESDAERIARAEDTIRKQREQELRAAGKRAVSQPEGASAPTKPSYTTREWNEAQIADQYINQQGSVQAVSAARASLVSAGEGVSRAEGKYQTAVEKGYKAPTLRRHAAGIETSKQTEAAAAAELQARRVDLNSVVKDAAIFAEGGADALRVNSVDEARTMADAENEFRLKEVHAREGQRTGEVVAQRRAERGGGVFPEAQLRDPAQLGAEADAAGERARKLYRERLDQLVSSTINERGKGADMHGEDLKFVEDVRHDLGVDVIPISSEKAGDSQLQYFTSHEPSINGQPGKKSDIIMVERRDLKTGKLLAAVTFNQPGLLEQSTTGLFRRRTKSVPTTELTRVMQKTSLVRNDPAEGGAAPLSRDEQMAISGDSFRYKAQDRRPTSEQGGANSYSFEDARGYDMSAWTAVQRGATADQLESSGLKTPNTLRKSWWQKLTNSGAKKPRKQLRK